MSQVWLKFEIAMSRSPHQVFVTKHHLQSARGLFQELTKFPDGFATRGRSGGSFARLLAGTRHAGVFGATPAQRRRESKQTAVFWDLEEWCRRLARTT